MICKLIKELFGLFVQGIRLKRISQAVDRYNRTNEKAKREAHIVHALVDRYNEIFKNDSLEFEEEDEHG